MGKSICRTIDHFFTRTFFIAEQSRKEDLERIACLLNKVADIQKQLRMYCEFWRHAAEAFVLINVDTEMVLDANPAACAMYGYRHEDMLKKKITELSDEPESTRAGIQEKAPFIEFRWHRKRNNIRFPVQINVSYFNDQGYPVCAAILRELPMPKEIVDEVI